MLPGFLTEAEKNAVIETARGLTAHGYVYIASPAEGTMEDRENIRFLPLNLENLPCFGAVTAVCVVKDETIAIAAREAYPGTEVIVIDPGIVPDEEASERPAVPEWLSAKSRTDALQAA